MSPAELTSGFAAAPLIAALIALIAFGVTASFIEARERSTDGHPPRPETSPAARDA